MRLSGEPKPKVPLESIANAVPLVEGKTQEDSKDQQEARASERRRREAETGQIVESNLDRRANRRLRFRYAKLVYCYMVCYSLFCAGLVILAGFKIGGFILPESVFALIVGSTAASAIGLVGFVINGLFKGQ